VRARVGKAQLVGARGGGSLLVRARVGKARLVGARVVKDVGSGVGGSEKAWDG